MEAKKEFKILQSVIKGEDMAQEHKAAMEETLLFLTQKSAMLLDNPTYSSIRLAATLLKCCEDFICLLHVSFL